MGNCCGSEDKSANFAGEGRTLGSAPAPDAPPNPASAPLPSGVGQTLGGASSAAPPSAAADAARQAALDRLNRANSAPKGKLGENLAQQKKQTRTDTLEAAAREERLARETDQNTRDLQHS